MAKLSNGNHHDPSQAHHVHDHSHGPECSLKGYVTYIRCQGLCGTLMPFPSPIKGERAYFCDACLAKRTDQQSPTKAEREAGLRAMERPDRPVTMPAATPEPEPYYEPTPDELAWARAEIARQQAEAGLERR